MPSTCPNAHQWLRLTIYQWLQPTSSRASRQRSRFALPCVRHVSTTSAINRGLRAEVDNEAHFSSNKSSTRRGESLIRTHGSFGNTAFANEKQYAFPKVKDAGMSSGRSRGFRKIGVEPEQIAANTGRGDVLKDSLAVSRGAISNRRRKKRAMMLDKQRRDAAAEETGDDLGRDSFVEEEQEDRIDPSKTQPWRGRFRKSGVKTEVFKYTETDNVEGMASAAGGQFERQRFGSSEEVCSGAWGLQNAYSFIEEQIPASEPVDQQVEGVVPPSTTDQGSTTAPYSKLHVVGQSGNDYEDLLLLTRALQRAEFGSDPDSRNLREKTQAQLGELIDTLNGEFSTISEKKSILQKILGPHTTIASESDKRRDYLWTTHKDPPRNMPRSIIWLDRGTGNVELIPPALKVLWANKSVGSETKSTGASRSENQVHKIVDRIGYQALQAVVVRCGVLLRSIQAAQRTNQDLDGAKVNAEIAELRWCVSQLNEDFARERRVHYNVVRTAMTAELGVPGRFWTKFEPDGRKTILWYDETSGKTELVLKEAGEPVESAEGEQTSNASEKVGTEPQSAKDGGRAQAVQKVRDLLGRCRNYLVNVQEKEKSSQSTHRGRRELLVAQHKMVELVNKVNLLVETGEVDLSDLRFAVKRELGKQFELWSLTQPDGQKTVVWLNEAQKQLVIVGKVSRLPDNELLEVGQERLLKGNLPDVAQETNAKKTARKAKEDHGPAWGEVRDWIRSQTGSVEKRNTGRRETNDAKAKPVRDEMPISVPYTTAASTFVYGANAVLACLSAKKRKFYHLYFARSEADVDSTDTTKDQIQKLGREADIPTTYSTSKQLLAKMSDRRAHNGIALEASQISAPPVLGIGKPDMHHSIMPVQLDRQSPEEIVVNGAPTALPLITKTWRHPFVLMLDGILDEGNLGNILRTAYFYGVDAVAISKNTCASVNSPIVAKASSGAIEAVQILSLPFPSKFVYNCLRSSWRVYAAVAPPAVIPSGETGKYLTHASIASRSPLQDHACILMLGAEGEGLRGNLKTRADYFVSIEQGERAGMAGGLLPGIGVDSMNVSSAAGVLVESFMRKPQGAQLTGVGGALGF